MGDKKVTMEKVSMIEMNYKELMGMKNVNRVHLLEPFLKERQPIMVYSKTGLGKSWFTLTTALVVASGGEFAGFKAPTGRRVAYFDGEMSIEDLQQRIKSLVSKLNLNTKLIEKNFKLLARTYQPNKCSLPDLNNEEEAEMILDYVVENEIALVVLDNYSTLVNSVEDENSASSFNNVMNLLQELSKVNCASILVHHSGKNNAKSNYRGSSKMAVLMETIIKLDENINAKFDEVSFKVIFEKFRQKHTQETLERILTLKDRWEVEEDTESYESKVVAMIKSLKYSMDKEVYEALGISQSSFSKLKQKIIAKGFLTFPEWSLCLQKARDIDNEFVVEELEEDSDY